MKTLLSSLLIFCAVQAMALTNSYVRFIKHSTKFEYAQIAAALPDGSAVLVSHNFTDSILHLVKVNMFTGAVLWDKQYSMNAALLRDFYVSSFQYTSGSQLLLGGEHHQNGFPNTTYPAVLCFDTSGTLLWNLIDFDGDHYGAQTAEIFPGRSVVVEGNYNNAHTIYKSQLLKVNTATGAALSAKEYAFTAGNYVGFSGIAPANNGSFIAAGVVPSFYHTPYHYDMSMTKLDSSLNVLWTHVFRDTLFNSIRSILPYSNGGWLLLGAGFYDDRKENGTLLMAVDSTGHPLWAKQYSDTAHLPGGYATHFAAASLTPASDGNYLISGQYEFPNGGDVYSSSVVIKVDTSGNLLYARTYGTTTGTANPFDGATAVFDIGVGNYFFAGRTGYNGNANTIFGQDNPALLPRAACFSRTPGIAVTNVLSQIRDTAITLTVSTYTSPLGRFTYNTQTNSPVVDTVACSKESAVQQVSPGGHLTVYPNPAQTTACFEWKGGTPPHNASLQVYDIGGRLMSNTPFAGRLLMNTENLQRGIYYYRLNADSGIAVKGVLVTE